MVSARIGGERTGNSCLRAGASRGERGRPVMRNQLVTKVPDPSPKGAAIVIHGGETVWTRRRAALSRRVAARVGAAAPGETDHLYRPAKASLRRPRTPHCYVVVECVRGRQACVFA